MVNLNDIKDKLIEKKVRKTFKVGKHKVEVYNIAIEDVASVYDKIKDFYNLETEEFIVKSEEAMSYIYGVFTNIEIDNPSDLLEILASPNSKLKDIQREVVKSMTEVVKHYINDKITELENIELAMATKELTSKSKKLVKELGVNIEKQ